MYLNRPDISCTNKGFVNFESRPTGKGSFEELL